MPSDLCLLHIGKTGGTYLKSVLEHNKMALPETLRVLDHRDTIRSTRQKFGVNRRIAFVFRDPTERFVSGFDSRLCQGRPTYQSMWTPEEAIAYQWFDSPNALAEALYSEDERLFSAVIFAMENIRHLKRGYKFFLGGVSALRQEDSRISCCVDLKDLDQLLPEVMRNLGMERYEMPLKAVRHKSKPAAPLSKQAARNLRKYWSEEYEIYAYCQRIQRT